jgi:hypothetical protein
MKPEEFAGIAAAVLEVLRPVEARLDALATELPALRTLASDPIAAFLLDAEGVLHVVQRNGEELATQLPNVAALLEAAGVRWRDQVRAELALEQQAAIARAIEAWCNAPAWSATAVYTEGQIVQAHVGRTYRVRAGVKATLGTDPATHPEAWERLGSGGFRVLKSRPDQLEPGDVFTENESRFMHDGTATILFVPKAAKVSDIERAVKAPHALAQSVQAQLQELTAQVNALQVALRGTSAANESTLELTCALTAEVESLRRRFDPAPGSGA